MQKLIKLAQQKGKEAAIEAAKKLTASEKEVLKFKILQREKELNQSIDTAVDELNLLISIHFEL